ncbi:putative secondary metabolism biosynthetic enzyme [Bacidia gigantensis]|uniref:putative secondary metabolism biosynthetic enzyme n=1 Tax=Bacidia gigantensis TaxID=2732470 RepID=UPI001D059A66|nr:putative secondary metabolism biosynthetic enzyme [Bacidia gigantensis]KAG8528568.1 putative secondary metabolism biosynthetic enzyme [Bacidia gigantensis]
MIHFAAYSYVQDSFEDPRGFTLGDVVATQRLLEAIRHHSEVSRTRRFIYVSTDKVYSDATGRFVDETEQFMPTNLYSASKAAAKMYVSAYAKSFDIPALVVRSNNVYGPCLNVRRYLYAADAADGFDTLLHRGIVSEAYNLNSSFAVTNLEVAIHMLEIFG